MVQQTGTESRRQTEQSERSYAEKILGNEYDVRVYATVGSTARGTVTVKNGVDSASVHTAYVMLSGERASDRLKATAVGVIIDRKTGSSALVLSEKNGAEPFQYEIAEAVDYWEKGNDIKIYCLKEKSCGAVVYTGDGENRRYLIIRMNLGHCGLPKGHIEKFETERETALREVWEETGVEIALHPDFRKSVVYSLTARTTKESVYFLGRFDGDTVRIQESEVSAYRLCTYEEARRFITYENDRVILDAAEKLLNGE